MGRCKMEIDRMENQSEQKITFDKRIRDLLTEAEKIALLCDVDLGLVVFSRTGKLYDYSNTEMELVINRYLKYKAEHPKNDDSDDDQDEEIDYGVQLPEKNLLELLQTNMQSGQMEMAGLINSDGLLEREELDYFDSSSLLVLQNILESNLQTVKVKKEQRMINENQKLKQMAEELQQEHRDFLSKINDMKMQNYELYHQMYLTEKSTGASSAGPELRKTREHSQVPLV